MKTWDVVIIGGGIIGLSLALELRRHGADVLVLDRGQPGHEASHAAAGMLAYCDPHTPAELQPLAVASAQLYPEYVHELADESGVKIDLRSDGSILFVEANEHPTGSPAVELSAEELACLEPAIGYRGRAFLLPEKSVDPRDLISALLKAAKHRGIEIASGTVAEEVEVNEGRAGGVRTSKTRFAAAVVVNCGGAWAGQIGPRRLPIRPIKGQMLAVAAHGLLRHVVRGPGAYLVPRTSGRVLIGSTLEDVGFDKRVDPDAVQRLHQAAANLVPQIGEARILEDWAGLRPATPDGLPCLGPAGIKGYFIAAGHYRDGILLAPITALIMTDLVRGRMPEFDITPFSSDRLEA